jgi:hypothetical protein
MTLKMLSEASAMSPRSRQDTGISGSFPNGPNHRYRDPLLSEFPQSSNDFRAFGNFFGITRVETSSYELQAKPSALRMN